MLVNNVIRVIPGKIKAFITDEMRALLRSMYDRGVLSKQSGAEDIADVDFEVEVERRIKEKERKLQEIMYPHITQNLEQNENLDLEDQGKKPGSPEADNFNNAVVKQHLKKKKQLKAKEVTVISYETIDDLPEDVTNILPVSAQVVWLKEFNSVLEDTENKEKAAKNAWLKVKEKYESVEDENKWVKKASVEDYESTMSPYTFKFFKEVYQTTFEQADSSEKAIKTALAIVESVSTKNKNGILVKDKTITKSQMEAMNNANLSEQILNLELKAKKLELLNQIIKENKE